MLGAAAEPRASGASAFRLQGAKCGGVGCGGRMCVVGGGERTQTNWRRGAKPRGDGSAADKKCNFTITKITKN